MEAGCPRPFLNMFDPEPQLVTVATYHNEMDLLLARMRLESAGIECFAQDENMLRLAGWHSHFGGGIRLQVRESDAADALAILRHTAPIEAD
jgi:hypothetical protein